MSLVCAVISPQLVVGIKRSPKRKYNRCECDRRHVFILDATVAQLTNYMLREGFLTGATVESTTKAVIATTLYICV